MVRIAVIQTAFPGDVVLSTPVFEALKDEFPGCETVAVVRPESIPLLGSNPHIDRVLSFDKYGADKGLSGLIRTAARLKGCDRAIIIQRHLRSAVVAYLARIPMRIGYSNSNARFLYTDRVEYRGDKHEVQRCLDLIGISDDDKYRPKIFLDDGTNRKAEDLLRSVGAGPDFAVVAPGSIWPTKRYPYFPGLIHLVNEELSLPVVLIGGPSDIELSNAIAESCKKLPPNITGETNLLESATIISKAKLAVTNDSAPAHIAAAVDTPVVAIFGPTVQEFGFSPYSEKSSVVDIGELYCRPCTTHGSARCPQRHFKCMLELQPAKIIEAAKLLLGG